jgi:protein-disulfide isomerase
VPSGKASRAQRHPPRQTRLPTPPSKGPSGRRQASPKVLLGVGAGILVAAVAVVLAIVLGGGSSGVGNVPAKGSLSGALPGAAAVQRLFRGVPQNANILGDSSAPVTLVEYVDLQCPYCREFETTVVPTLVTRYVRTGKLRVDQRLLAFIGPDSARGRSAAIAAGEQGKQFNYTELLYFNQGTENTGWLDEKMVVAAGASVPGLRVPELLTASKSGAVADQATVFDDEAKADGVDSTPTLLVGKTGGTLHKVAITSPTDARSVAAAIDAALAGSS